MALAVEWLPEEWPEGIPNLKQLLVVAPLTTSILLLFRCGNRNPRTVWPIVGRVAVPPSAKPADFVWPTSPHTVISSGAGRLYSSAFAPANASACAERNLSSPLLTPPNSLPSTLAPAGTPARYSSPASTPHP